MKKALLIACIFTFLLSFQAISQAGQASLTKSGAVVLSNDEPLKDHYVLSADHFNFESDQEAMEHFASVSSNHVVYRMNRYNGTLNVHLQTKKEPNWTINDWNNYLAEHKAMSSTTTHQTSK